MSAALQLVTHELLFVAVVSAIGLTPASMLGPSFGRTARLALAPVLGLCVATSVFTTLIWFVPASKTYWLVGVLAGASMLLGTARLFRNSQEPDPYRIPWRNTAVVLCQCICIAIVVLGPATLTLAQNKSVGPVAYQVPDAGGYVLETDGMIHESMRQAASLAKGPWDDLVQAYWTGYSFSNQEMSLDPVAANIDVLLGEGATQTQSAFLLATLFVGALGAYATVIHLLRRRHLAAVLAGVLFGGAFFLQLFFDGSEGAISGLAVLIPLVLLGHEALRGRGIARLVLLAIVVAASMALYPLFLPAEILAAGLVLVVSAQRVVRDRGWSALVLGIVELIGVAVLALVLDLVASIRDARYILHVADYVHTQPNYQLPTTALLSWLTQVRGFYDLAFSGHSSLSNVLLGVALPLTLAGVTLGALKRQPVALVTFVYALCVCVFALYERTRVKSGATGCTYCEERTLLPLAVVFILLFCLGLGVVSTFETRVWRLAALLLGLGALGLISFSSVTARDKFASSYFLPQSVSTALSYLPRGAQVALEGFDEATPNPPAELMLTYARADEENWMHVSFPADFDENNSLLYFGNLGEKTLRVPNPQFHIPFRYVLTRAAGVRTDRTTLFRDGAIALEKVGRGGDALLDYGFSLERRASVDRTGIPVQNAWVSEPMHFVVTGTASQPAYVRLWFALPSWLYSTRVTGKELVKVSREPHKMSVCLKSSGPANEQSVTLRFPAGTGERLLQTAVAERACP